MGISISEQSAEFLLSCLLGMGVGVLYDCFRIVRIAFPFGKIIIFVEDILFWLLAAVATFFFLLIFSDGQVRLYIMLGELLGFVLYYFTVGALIFRASNAIIGLVKRILRCLYRVFIAPFVKFLMFVYNKVRALFVHIGLYFKKMRQNTKMHLPNRGKVLYNQNDTVNMDDSKKRKRSKRNKKERI